MPCSDGGGSREEERRSYESMNAEKQAKLDNVTRLLCELCECIENRPIDLFASVAGLKIWWVEHKRRDAEKAALMRGQEKMIQEKIAKREMAARALNKLSLEERRALRSYNYTILESGHWKTN